MAKGWLKYLISGKGYINKCEEPGTLAKTLAKDGKLYGSGLTRKNKSVKLQTHSESNDADYSDCGT